MKISRILAVLPAFLLSSLCLFSQEYRFTHIDASDGLSHNHVKAIIKDRTGFLWIGTPSGLNRFDGYSIKVFRNDPSDSTSLLNNNIDNLFELPDGKIGLITGEGLAFYDPASEKFTSDLSFLSSNYGLPANSLTNVIRDRSENHWFLISNSGLVCYNTKEKRSVYLKHDPADSSSIASNTVTWVLHHPDGSYWIIHSNGVLENVRMTQAGYRVVRRNRFLHNQLVDKTKSLSCTLFADSDGDLWINVLNDNLGAFYFDVDKNKTQHLHTKSKIGRLNADLVTRIVQDSRGYLWLATDHGGINVIDKKHFTVRYLSNNPENEFSLGQNSITALYQDDEGIIWVGTYKKGLSYYHENIIRFPLYNRYSEPDGLPYEDVNRFLEDDKGNLWIGTNGGGLLYFDRHTRKFTLFKHDPNNPNSLSSNVIVSLCVDHEKKLWIGTYFGGLNCFDGRTFKRYNNDPADSKSISGKSVWEILEDSQQRLWIGTLEGGLNQFDRKTNSFIRYPIGGAGAIQSTYISVIKEDKQGNLWFGTSNGIDVLTKSSDKFVHYGSVRNDPSSLLSNIIYDIEQDSYGRILVGTLSGLSIFNVKKKTFTTFTEKNGLPHNSILTIVEDTNGSLWLATSNGLSRMDLLPGSFGADSITISVKNYTAADGLQGLQFNEDASYRTSSGELIFGGANGFNIFKPDDLGLNSNKPKVVFSDFQLFNRSIKAGEDVDGDVLLERSITHAPAIVLPASKNVFSIEFAALNFFQSEKNSYKYKLEGFNDDWLPADSKSHKVTFTNLDAGDYVFRVIAANNDGVWNYDGVALPIKVLPPFWKSNIAFVLYIVIVMLALLVTRKLIQQREQMKFAIQQERQEALRMHELDMMKIKFFTNVSHEFRTPLSLILSPIEKLQVQADSPDQKKHFDLIQRNAKRLLNLVNQLLDFRKMEVQELKFQPSEGDVIKFIRETVYSFSDLSEKKDIKLEFNTNVSSLETIFDQDKLERILFNLLSNAFKFTSGQGMVSVSVELTDGIGARSLRISVKDTGIGIARDKQERIFERFFQNDLPRTMVNQGSGIGLSITREFVKIHGGTISVESELGKGSCFIVELPVKEITQKVTEPVSEVISAVAETEHHENHEPAVKGEQVILLVEDNEDFRFYLKDNLKVHYKIVEAGSGEEGWKKAISHFPDLIVSDVMMPGMNGFELCKKVKSDQRVSHIPVILLTAKTSAAERLEGIESGADDYINKPFNYEILESRIRNLITQRDKLHRSLTKQMGIKASELQITSLDEQFIKNAIAIIEKNVSNTDFTVVDLSRELGISRAHFFKKIFALTGKSPLEFIRAIRMQQAAQLLEKSQLSVAEVAYKVGFNNPKYFAKYFKEVYHVLPSAYAAGKRRN